MSRHWAALAVFATLGSAIYAQDTLAVQRNLVYNPSFEDHTECPRKIEALGVLTIVEGWYQPTEGSADYYNSCGSRDCGVPNNKIGRQYPHSGEGYCGIYCSKNEYREYLQTQLKEPLEAGCTYEVKFYASLSEYSTGAIATIGALFTDQRISDTIRGILMKKELRPIAPGISQAIATYYTPQIVNSQTIIDTAGWHEIIGAFTAQGGEQFLTIGNFYPIARSEYEDYDYLTHLLSGSYYYIDDVSVTRISKPEQAESKTTAIPQLELEIGKTIKLENIFFQFDKSVLLQQSYNQLIDLFNTLVENPKMRIEVQGHTDNKGSAEYNQKLSESRAKAIADYLISKGINPRRIEYKGFGKSKPVDSNDTEAGRANNRRVEIKILSL